MFLSVEIKTWGLPSAKQCELVIIHEDIQKNNKSKGIELQILNLFPCFTLATNPQKVFQIFSVCPALDFCGITKAEGSSVVFRGCHWNYSPLSSLALSLGICLDFFANQQFTLVLWSQEWIAATFPGLGISPSKSETSRIFIAQSCGCLHSCK